ncbi:family 10 glycosylhydrolase [Streptosporangiaceae bacterium NEAU-GS5]|nr:family 10 glycosylhydrolase [Streptosporangiaceae bacterium NEAU-GS5]
MRTGGSVRNAVIAAAVALTSAAGGVAYALGSGAAADGAAGVRATAAKACAANTAFPKRQLRGVWIATVHNVDWPTATGQSVARQQADYVKILDNAVKRRFNAVFVQVRPASDAIYRSSLEPWSQFLTGKAGKDPGWDPLPFLIDEAHRRGLEFHAWFNPYRAAIDGDVSKLPAGHPARQHPDWIVKHEGRLYYNPGLPAVRDHVTQVIKDVVSRYDVDGVHFDDYFYPYPGKGTKFADSAAFKAFGKGMSLGDWRRDNVNKLIAQVSAAVHATKPYVKFGISPFGIWRNKSEDPSGSATSGMSAYSAIYADAKAWIKARTVDYVIPQLYWPRGFKVADYEKLVKWWAGAVRGTGVDLYIGQALYRVGSKDTAAWTKPGEMPSHLAFNKKFPEVQGDVYFSAANLAKNPLKVLDRLVKEQYSRPALVPLIQGLPARAPAAPRGLRTAAQGGALTWLAQPDARAYAVYRTTPARAACATSDAADLVAVIPAGGSPAYVTSAAGVYQVTALDRLGNESAPTQLVVNPAR